MSTVKRYLMCRPDYFEVSYAINPWMEDNLNGICAEKVRRQWGELYDLMSKHAEVSLVEPQPGLPDMVFTANAGLVIGDKAVLSRFLHPERQGEEKHFKRWFTANNYTVHKLPPQVPFEGAGDVLLDRKHGWLWAGHGWRSSLESHKYLTNWFDIEVLSLRLVKEHFFHLDTCFSTLPGGYVVYYPPALDEPSRQLIAERVPEDKHIMVGDEDAFNFACNMVNIDDVVILNRATPELARRLERAGLKVIQVEVSEFLKAGGSVRCLTLRLNDL
jgi:N-dimethylarginine dimethylaminohydrolase